MGSKQCIKCSRVLEVDIDFPKYPRCKDGRSNVCKTCTSSYQKRYRRDNFERLALQQSAHKKIYYREHPDKVTDRALRYKYKITLAERNALILSQGGCGLCGTLETVHWRVDHDHKCCPGLETCGKCIRSILCQKCNIGLGMFNESPELLRAAASYIQKHRE